MPRRPRCPAEVALDLLAEGKTQHEIAKEHHVAPTTVESVLYFERRRQNCRTNMQLLAVHLKRKLAGG